MIVVYILESYFKRLSEKSELKQMKEFPFHFVNKHILTSNILFIFSYLTHNIVGRGRSE